MTENYGIYSLIKSLLVNNLKLRFAIFIIKYISYFILLIFINLIKKLCSYMEKDLYMKLQFSNDIF